MQEFNGTHTIMDPLKKTDIKKVVHKYIIIIENVCGRASNHFGDEACVQLVCTRSTI
jgi:hypothetical protein